jgi:hypothetical protein
MRVVYVDSIHIPFRAICLAPFVILVRKKYKGNFGLLRHELIHWKQYKRMGFILFYSRYILQYFLFGYDNMPMELEARQGENHYGLWNYRQKYHNKK